MWKQSLIAVTMGACFITRAASLSMNVATDDRERLAYVNLWDRVEPGDDQRFRAMILPYLGAGYLIFQVNVFSPGGRVDAAEGIGRQIRVLKAMTQAPFSKGNRAECLYAETSKGSIERRVVGS